MDPRTTPLTCEVVLSVNGADHALQVDTRMTLLDALRDRLDLTGAKKGCDHGQCGACTIHIDGERHLACLTLTVAAQRRRITTVEGLAHGDLLHPMQQAFIDPRCLPMRLLHLGPDHVGDRLRGRKQCRFGP